VDDFAVADLERGLAALGQRRGRRPLPRPQVFYKI
jgi:hypothetical protein